jgi:MFS family permease
MYVHLIDILVSNHLSMPVAISLGALLGPSQVGVRVLEIVLPKRTPVKTAVFASLAIFFGLLLLTLQPGVAFLGIICYGLGNGMRSILRGTLPLWIFGSGNYATLMGKLALPPLVAQAATPFIAGFFIQHFGTQMFVVALGGLALVNVLVCIMLRNSLETSIQPAKRLVHA